MPQEEVPLYESKGKQFVNRQLKTAVTLPAGVNPHHSIPGLFISSSDEKEKIKSKKKPSKSNKPLILEYAYLTLLC